MIRLLNEHDAALVHALRREALIDSPLAFGSSPEDDRFQLIESVREGLRQGPDSVIAGAFENETLVGMAGLRRDAKLKARHRAFLWGMYVQPVARGRGHAAGLLNALTQHARQQPGLHLVYLSVTTAAAPAAMRVYERAGFKQWGTEPETLMVQGTTVDEHHMILTLESPA